MKKRICKWLSFILALALCAGCFSTGIFADEPAAAGEASASENAQKADPEDQDDPEGQEQTDGPGIFDETEQADGVEQIDETDENESGTDASEDGQQEEAPAADQPAEESGEQSSEESEQTAEEADIPGEDAPLYAGSINDHIPKNVKVQLLGEETDDSGRTYVIAEVSWDADSAIKMSEMRPFLADKLGNAAELLLNKKGQSIVREDVQEPGIPEDMRYRVVDGRNTFRLKIPKLKSGEQQFYQDSQGQWFARGIDEGGFALVFVQAAKDQEISDFSNYVEVEITEENVKKKTLFTEESSCDHADCGRIYKENGNGTHNISCEKCKAVLEEKVKCEYEWVNINDPHKHEIYCKYCKYKRGQMMHFFRTRSKDGLVEEYCACGYSNVTQETFDEKKQPGVTQTKWEKDGSKDKFPSTVKLPADADPEKAKLVAWENDDSVSKEPDGEQKLSSEMETHTNEKEGTKFIEVPGELEWKDGKKPEETDKVTIGVEYEKDGVTFIGDLITVAIGEEKNPCKHDGDNPFKEFETADPEPSHGIYCEMCGKRLGMELCDLIQERTNRIGSISQRCTECNYYARYVRCSHEGLMITRPFNRIQHFDYCSLCGYSSVSSIRYHKDKYEALNEYKCRDFCEECGYDVVENHWGDIQYTRYEYSRMWNCYYVWYKFTCKGCGTKVEGYIPYRTGATDWWIDFEPVFKKLVEGKLPKDWRWHTPDNYEKLEAMTIGFLLMPLYKSKDPDTGFSRAATLMFDYNKFYFEPGQDVRAFDKNGNEITGRKIPKQLKQNINALLPADDGEEGTPESEICYFDLTGLDEIHYALDGQMVEALEPGEHTVTMLFYDRNEEGEIRNPSAVNYTFTVKIVKDKDGNDVRAATRPVADGTMGYGDQTAQDAGPVFMNLSADAARWTGRAVAPPDALLETSKGVELPEDEYTLSYYRVGGDDGTELTPVAKDKIVDAGVYRVVAEPKEGSGFTGKASAQFRVAYDLSDKKLSAAIEAVPDQDYTGSALTPALKVTAIVNGKKKELAPSGAWTTTADGDGTTVSAEGNSGDYSVTYSDNIKVGEAAFEVTGEGIFMGTLTGTFQITGTPDLEHAVFEEIPDQIYTGKEIRPDVIVSINDDELVAGTDYEAEYMENVNAGTAAVIITGKGLYQGEAAVLFTINKAKPAITVKNKTVTYTGKAVASNKAKVPSDDKGKVTYAYYSDKACKKKIAASKVKDAGPYYVKATVAEDTNYKQAVSKAAKITIGKAANPLAVKGKTASVKAADLQKKQQTLVVSKTVTFTQKGQGTLTYTLGDVKKAKYKKYFTVDKKTGKLTVSKGLPKGTYTVQIKVKAAGNKNYKASAVKTAMVTVKVK